MAPTKRATKDKKRKLDFASPALETIAKLPKAKKRRILLSPPATGKWVNSVDESSFYSALRGPGPSPTSGTGTTK